jgi:hypothetical protein
VYEECDTAPRPFSGPDTLVRCHTPLILGCSLTEHSTCLLVGLLGFSSTLKMEALCSSETSVATQQTTRRHIPEDYTLHNHRCENLKSNIQHLSLYKNMSEFGYSHLENNNRSIKIYRLHILQQDKDK